MENNSLSGAVQGDLKDASKKKQTSFDVTNTPVRPGNPARAAAMQAQYQQPITTPRGTVKNGSILAPEPAQARPDGLAGGDLAQIGMRINDSLSAGVANPQSKMMQARFGMPRPSVAPVEQTAQTPAPIASANADKLPGLAEGLPVRQHHNNVPAITTDTEPQQVPQDGFVDTGIGQGLQGGAIAARLGAGGVMEFSNDAEVQAGAGAMPEGGLAGGMLKTPSVSNIADDVALEKRGSIKNVGNGIGTFSQAQAGDSKLALDRFDRANAIRAQTVQDGRRGVVGEGGGRLTIVADSSRSPSLQDFQHARLNERVAQTAALDKRGAREDQQLALNVNRDNRESAAAGIEMQTAQMGLDSGLRIEEIRQQLTDPTLPADQRARLERSYASLTTSAKDRYVLQDAVIGADVDGPKYGKIALDVVTGQPVGQSQAGQTTPSTEPKTTGKIYTDANGGRAKYLGVDAQGKDKWEEV